MDEVTKLLNKKEDDHEQQLKVYVETLQKQALCVLCFQFAVESLYGIGLGKSVRLFFLSYENLLTKTYDRLWLITTRRKTRNVMKWHRHSCWYV